MGYDFQGIYNLWEQNINLFSGDNRKNIEETIFSLMYKIQNWKKS
jgi:peptide chain release factor 3